LSGGFGSSFCLNFKCAFANFALIDWFGLITQIALIALGQACRTSLSTETWSRYNMAVSVTEAREDALTPSRPVGHDTVLRAERQEDAGLSLDFVASA
jgi:hypothetical protein